MTPFLYDKLHPPIRLSICPSTTRFRYCSLGERRMKRSFDIYHLYVLYVLLPWGSFNVMSYSWKITLTFRWSKMWARNWWEDSSGNRISEGAIVFCSNSPKTMPLAPRSGMEKQPKGKRRTEILIKSVIVETALIPARSMMTHVICFVYSPQ